MEYTKDDLLEAKRQIDSTLHKLREAIKTLQAAPAPPKGEALGYALKAFPFRGRCPRRGRMRQL